MHFQRIELMRKVSGGGAVATGSVVGLPTDCPPLVEGRCQVEVVDDREEGRFPSVCGSDGGWPVPGGDGGPLVVPSVGTGAGGSPPPGGCPPGGGGKLGGPSVGRKSGGGAMPGGFKPDELEDGVLGDRP